MHIKKGPTVTSVSVTLTREEYNAAILAKIAEKDNTLGYYRVVEVVSPSFTNTNTTPVEVEVKLQMVSSPGQDVVYYE